MALLNNDQINYLNIYLSRVKQLTLEKVSFTVDPEEEVITDLSRIETTKQLFEYLDTFTHNTDPLFDILLTCLAEQQA